MLAAGVTDQLVVVLVVPELDSEEERLGVGVPGVAVAIDVTECEVVAVCDGLTDTDTVAECELEELTVADVRLLDADVDIVAVGVGVSGGVIVKVSVGEGVDETLAVKEAVPVQLRCSPAWYRKLMALR